MDAGRAPPLIAHVIYRMAAGGLENGLINLVNGLPREQFRHAIISLTDATDFARRIRRDDVRIYCLNKRPGNDPGMHWRLWRLLRELRPAVVHSRNLAALETQFTAALAGVRHRIHGEHGRDLRDADGSSRRYQWVRRCFRPFVGRYVAVSEELQQYLVETIGVPAQQVERICNGVDVERFRPAPDGLRTPLPGAPWAVTTASVVIGSVGRMDPVKGHAVLASAFVELVRDRSPALPSPRLVLVGGGPELQAVRRILAAGGVLDACWFAGERDDISTLLQGMDLYVQPSLAEGISNTVLEAMACGLPVIASDVGGNRELIPAHGCGTRVPAGEIESLTRALRAYVDDARRRVAEGAALRERAVGRFGLKHMLRAYLGLYRTAVGADQPGGEPLNGREGGCNP